MSTETLTLIHHWCQETLLRKVRFNQFALLVILGEIFLNGLIIHYVPYTEIDWIAYMQQVQGYLGGQRNYTKLKGDTGPLVYPAGFLYVYSILYYLTRYGKDIKLAQYLFGFIYVLTMIFVFAIFKRCQSIPTYAIVFLTLSKRLHSIYVLRLFNDGVAMLGLYISLWLLVRRKWVWSAVWFSLALSIKMNILLFLPAYGLIYFQATGLLKTLKLMLILVLIQIWLAIPFLMTFPKEYLTKAFEFKRVFKYQWTVNWRMLPEDGFLSSSFSLFLLISHVLIILVFAWTRWCRAFEEDGLVKLLMRGLQNWNLPASKRPKELTPDYIIKVCFTSNLIGIICAKTLHYQFYCWYAHQIVFLLWQTSYSLLFKIGLLVAIEYSWNVFPATKASSSILLIANLLLLIGVWWPSKELKAVNSTKSLRKAKNV
ncbi:hypothetical protein O181_015977 [Austropuccinia psidii MF-1]|uniref:Dol-P-Man:Man(5)GlcNAc(2)-PP-Dol alpha-1,3-mannosyltransferase n=1 Tax=Austropuccinia psidii MF-1 TaxID=1389203 RepID=A0A9Q3GR90_9BASI|nr:hypothetical protein [Austropuccinia psidii MF-1]